MEPLQAGGGGGLHKERRGGEGEGSGKEAGSDTDRLWLRPSFIQHTGGTLSVCRQCIRGDKVSKDKLKINLRRRKGKHLEPHWLRG